MNVDIMNKYRFPHLYNLEVLGGVNTEEGHEYSVMYRKEMDAEYNELMTNIFYRGELFGKGVAKKIHISDGV